MAQRSLVSKCALVVVVIAIPVLAQIPCNDGFVEYTCATDYPVCCVWTQNDVVAACCPLGAACDLNAGYCIVHHTRNSSVPSPNTTAGVAPKSQGGITVAVSEAAAFITFGAIGFIVGLVGCAFLAFKVFICTRTRQLRRRQEAAEAAQLLRNAESESDPTATEEGDDDETGQCTICIAKQINCVLLPCAHVCTCRACAAKLTTCPMCRTEIKSFTVFKNKIYLKTSRSRPVHSAVDVDTSSTVVAVPFPGRATIGAGRCIGGPNYSEELTPTPRVPPAAVAASSTSPTPRPQPDAARGTHHRSLVVEDGLNSDVNPAPSHAAVESASSFDSTIVLPDAQDAVVEEPSPEMRTPPLEPPSLNDD